VVKNVTEYRSLARSYTVVALQRIAGLSQNAESEQIRLEASKTLLDRGWGVANQKLEHSTEDGKAFEIVLRHITEGSKAPQK